MAAKFSPLARARRAVGHSQEELAVAVGVDPATVGRWERGEYEPYRFRRPKLAALLRISRDELEWLLVETQHECAGRAATDVIRGIGPVRERAWAGTRELSREAGPEVTSGRVQADVPGRKAMRATVPVPRRLSWGDVERVQATTRSVATAENLYGGKLSFAADAAHVTLAAQLLDVSATSDVRSAMAEAVGNLSSVVAFSAFDIAKYDEADEFFGFALDCAEKSGSWELRANTLAEMARKAAYLNDSDYALELIESAQVRSDRLTDTARAMLSAVRARLLAVTGRHREAEDEVDRADDSFAHRDAGAEPPWLCYYDLAEHQGSTGKALVPIARSRHTPELAAGRLEDAIRLQNAGYPRSRAFSRIRLSSLLMSTGNLQEALPIARKALVDARRVRSPRLVGELKNLSDLTSQHHQNSDVAQLRRDIASVGQRTA